MFDSYGLIILPEAAQDIRNKEIKSLAYMPKRIRLVEEQPWKDAGIRRTREGNYYIYFFVDETKKTVYVNAVIYSGRDQTKQMASFTCNPCPDTL